jgi:hypothetical protein
MKRNIIHRNLKRGIFISATVILSVLSACKKFVDTPIPSNLIPASTALNSDGSLVAALAGAYAAVSNVSVSVDLVTPLFADEMILSNATGSNLQAQENTYDITVDYQFYSSYYKAIYNTNLILDALAGPNNITPAVASQVKGECEFLRAYCYYRLINYYGNVPLILSSNVDVSSQVPNTPVSQTLDQITKDLIDAKNLLPVTYPSADRVRANQYTVSALLARIYLQRKDWIDAEAAATAIIGSGTYTLPTDPNAIFIKGSTETIWQLWNLNGYLGAAATFIPLPTTTVYYQLQPGLVNLFAPTDLRKLDWMQAGTGGAATNYYPYKYKQRLATTGANTEYEVQFRLAEQYLIRAEARAEQNNISGGLADMNVVRARANAVLLTPTTQTDLLSKIADERRMELMTEEGLRWFDLNRTGTTAAVLGLLKPTFTAKAVLLPYPTSILLASPFLKQNPGY